MAARVATALKGTLFTTVTDLAKNAKYYWTVVPFDGKAYGVCPGGPWSFNVPVDAGRNMPPEFEGKPLRIAQVGVKWTYTPQASDPNAGDVVTITLITGPEGMTMTGGVLEWTPTTAQIGVHPLVLMASDGDLSTMAFENITVRAEDHAPVITPIDDITIEVGEVLAFWIEARDEDNDPMTYMLIQGAGNLSIRPKGDMTWRPTEADIGTHQIKFTVTDGIRTTEGSFNVTVKGKGGTGGAPLGWNILGPLIIVIVVVAVLVAAMMMRRKKGNTKSEATGQPPQPSPPSPPPPLPPQPLPLPSVPPSPPPSPPEPQPVGPEAPRTEEPPGPSP
jgi:hypothetical protein